jgi:hypothetical protein
MLRASAKWAQKLSAAKLCGPLVEKDGEIPLFTGIEGRQIPSSASKHAEIRAKLDIPSNPATILREPTQRRQLSCGWRQTGPVSQNVPAAREKETVMGWGK